MATAAAIGCLMLIYLVDAYRSAEVARDRASRDDWREMHPDDGPDPADLPARSQFAGTTDPIGFLEGRWRAERRLTDLETGAEGEFVGVAEFARDGTWTETGRLRFGAYDGEARRTLRLVDGAVEFEDGRPFHPLDLRTGACAVEHLCGEDRYAGEYRVVGPDELQVDWYVVGPRKRQLIETVYRRA